MTIFRTAVLPAAVSFEEVRDGDRWYARRAAVNQEEQFIARLVGRRWLRSRKEGLQFAIICESGHVFTGCGSYADDDFGTQCTTCGAALRTTCPSCDKPIRGMHHEAGLGAQYTRPACCHACGKPYPWTTARLDAARELLEELDELSDDEREKLGNVIPSSPSGEIYSPRLSRDGSVSKCAHDDLFDALQTMVEGAVQVGGEIGLEWV
jgi:hypothetical protein